MSGNQGGLDLDLTANAAGAVQALRTGNIKLDMMIAMLIPAMFRILFTGVGDFWKRVKDGDFRLAMLIFFWRRGMVERVIEHKATSNIYGDNITERDTRNNVLMKAIQLYLDQKEMKWERSRVELTSISHKDRPWWWGGDDGDERSPAGKLKKYRLTQKAPNFVWQDLGYYGGKKPDGTGKEGTRAAVELRAEETEEDKAEGKKTVQSLRYRFRSRSAEAIDSFISEAYSWYLEELKKEEDNARYLYEMQVKVTSSSLTGEKESAGARTYKRYKLSDHKTFASLFFEEKSVLLGLLEHFRNKSGKYAIAGYPHKLGLLLHGPPGTGKTSLIKALAQHTGRSIVNVPLARISTNQELMDIMFDQQYMVEGEEVPIKLGFKDVIFVMEDVDAASKVVQRRDGKETHSVTRTEVIEAPTPKSPWQILLECDEEDCREVTKKLIGKSPRLREAALSSGTLCTMVRQLVAPPGLGLLVGASTGDAAEDRKQREEANSVMEKINSQRENAQKYIKQYAASLKQLIEVEGSDIDERLVDDLLGLNATSRSAPTVRLSSLGYGASSSSAKPDTVEEEEEGGGMDLTLAMGMLASMMDQGGGEKEKERMGGGGGSGFGPTTWSSTSSKKDTLNLSGLLNVLDGVVDTPDRILIMTTNHPEHLDPALIRPGRIDKKILLGYMTPTHAAAMIEHYFEQSLSPAHRDRLRSSILGNDQKGLPALNLTPAQVEQLAAENDEVEDMLQALERKAAESAPPRYVSAARHTEVGPPLAKTSSFAIENSGAAPSGGAEAAGAPPTPSGRKPHLERQSSASVTFDS